MKELIAEIGQNSGYENIELLLDNNILRHLKKNCIIINNEISGGVCCMILVELLCIISKA